MSILESFFGGALYVRVRRNRLRIRNLKDGQEIEITPETPFTGPRLLVSDFAAAEKALKRGMKELYKGAFFRPSPRVLIQQLEMNEGGLCLVEQRLLQELAIGSGAVRAKVWQGKELSDSEALKELEE